MSSTHNATTKNGLDEAFQAKLEEISPGGLGVGVPRVLPSPPPPPPPPAAKSLSSKQLTREVHFNLPDIFNYNFEKGDLRDRWNDKEENLSDYFNYGMNEDIFRLYRKKVVDLTELMRRLQREHGEGNREEESEADLLTIHASEGPPGDQEKVQVMRPNGQSAFGGLGVEFGGMGPVMTPNLVKDELTFQLNSNQEKFWLKHINMDPVNLFKFVIIQAYMEVNTHNYKNFTETSTTNQLLQQEERLLSYYKRNFRGDQGYLGKLWELGRIRRDDLRLYKGKQYMGVDSHYAQRGREWNRVKFGEERRRRNEDNWGSSRLQERQRNVNMYKNYGEPRRRVSRSESEREEERRRRGERYFGEETDRQRRGRGRGREGERERDRKAHFSKLQKDKKEKKKKSKREKKDKKEKKKKKKREIKTKEEKIKNGKNENQEEKKIIKKENEIKEESQNKSIKKEEVETEKADHPKHNLRNRHENEKRKKEQIDKLLKETRKEFKNEKYEKKYNGKQNDQYDEEYEWKMRNKFRESQKRQRETQTRREEENGGFYLEGRKLTMKRPHEEFRREGRDRERREDFYWRRQERDRRYFNRYRGRYRRF